MVRASAAINFACPSASAALGKPPLATKAAWAASMRAIWRDTLAQSLAISAVRSGQSARPVQGCPCHGEGCRVSGSGAGISATVRGASSFRGIFAGGLRAAGFFGTGFADGAFFFAVAVRFAAGAIRVLRCCQPQRAMRFFSVVVLISKKSATALRLASVCS